MGKRSKHRYDKRKKDAAGFIEEDEIMALSINGEDQPRNAKQSAKLKRRLRKQQRKREKQQGKNQPGGNQKGNTTRWHKIEIIGSEAMEKDFIYNSIGSSLELQFQPLGFHKVDKMCCFYLEDNESAAGAIHCLSKRIQDSNGNLLKINSKKIDSPDLALNSDQLQILREVMSRRFDGSSSLLDLTNLHHDAALLEKDILAPLAAMYVMKQVVKVIKENIPHLKALNLGKNNLHGRNLSLLECMHVESSQLFALNLEHNSISDLKYLKHLTVFPITELTLRFNPVVEIYKDKPLRYIELTKRYLPKLKILDAVNAEVYLAENGKRPLQSTSSSSFQYNAAAGNSKASSSVISDSLVRSFLEQYYALIDAPDRDKLLAAYTPDAVLEIVSHVGGIASSSFAGQEKIKEALCSFPATKHEHGTFSFNIQFLDPNTAQAVVMGQCQISGLDAVVKFTRTMNIVPFNAGLCCSRDVLELR